jgi:prepilin-type N-terminal cleavage/methylation domain-containing protein
MSKGHDSGMPQTHLVRAVRGDARAGFTLVELLVAIVFICVLSAIATQHIQDVKQHAYIAALQSDLHNLATAEEGYFIEYQTYTPSMPQDWFTPTVGDQYTITDANATGWAATVTRTNGVGLAVSSCHMASGTSETTATEWPGAPYCP